MDELIKKIRGENDPVTEIASAVYSVDFSSGYVLLKEDVTKLVKQQTEFKKLVKSKNSIPYAVYFRLRKGFCRRILKRKQYTLEELFDIQLSNISSLNNNLQWILSDSRLELNKLEEYFEQVNNEVTSMLSGRGGKFKEMEEKSRLYQKLNNDLRASRKDERYFRTMVTKKKLKRELYEFIHKHNLTNELSKNLSEESLFLDRFEDLLRISIHTCERIALKTATLERHLSNTKRTYQLLKVQQKTVSSLTNAVDTMTSFTLQLQETLADGLEKIVEIANSPEDYYASSINNFNSLLSGINQRNYPSLGA